MLITAAHTSLTLYNTLSKRKEAIKLRHANHVGLYVCGMTVYDDCHIGHARVWVIFDVLVRYLTQLGHTVNYVRNITDVDDKIIQRASRNKESIQALTSRMILSMHEDMAALQLLTPHHEPRATQHVPNMIALIQTLLKKGYAYIADTGDVYYSIDQFERYGQFTQQSIKELLVGARIPTGVHKNNPLDFVLWKKIADTDQVGWESPWGRGRPGWHLECSAMALHYLGNSFDLHGGGADLIFPHHQNEIAQSEAATGQPFATHWMHVGFVTINQDKMSKSLGNALTIKTLLKDYPGEIIRYFLLTSQYRSPLVYQANRVKAAKIALKRLYTATQLADNTVSSPLPDDGLAYEASFHAALQDDLNTPVALSTLFDITRHINRLGNHPDAIHLAKLLKRLGGCLGLLQQKTAFLSNTSYGQKTEWIIELIQRRQVARQQQEWMLADNIRKLLLEKGILIKDTHEGTDWEYSKEDDQSM